MTLRTFLSILLLAALTGCTLPPPAQPLILTREDLLLKRKPYQDGDSCVETETVVTKTYYSK
ncbi:MAG TPA: hypothetical protein VHM91_09135 [Verrucomicrobiales bacterium]|jgi:hypothetical protein|nr:hypothetical protein [Verrucomicrobiales bacterium]